MWDCRFGDNLVFVDSFWSIFKLKGIFNLVFIGDFRFWKDCVIIFGNVLGWYVWLEEGCLICEGVFKLWDGDVWCNKEDLVFDIGCIGLYGLKWICFFGWLFLFGGWFEDV